MGGHDLGQPDLQTAKPDPRYYQRGEVYFASSSQGLEIKWQGSAILNEYYQFILELSRSDVARLARLCFGTHLSKAQWDELGMGLATDALAEEIGASTVSDVIGALMTIHKEQSEE